ncbi:unnamed protein product, partial [Pylaiella littoralis]
MLGAESQKAFARAMVSGQEEVVNHEALLGKTTEVGGSKTRSRQPGPLEKTNGGSSSKKPVPGRSPLTAGAKEKGKKSAVGGGGRGKPVPRKSAVTKKPGGVQEKGKKQVAGGGSKNGKGGSVLKMEKDVRYDSDGSIGGGDD